MFMVRGDCDAAHGTAVIAGRTVTDDKNHSTIIFWWDGEVDGALL